MRNYIINKIKARRQAQKWVKWTETKEEMTLAIIAKMNK